MLQGLLMERFALKIHRDKREQAGYALVLGKDGPRLKLAASSPAPVDPADDSATLRRMSSEGKPDRASTHWFRLSSATSAELAHQLSRVAGEPVVDMTGLTGNYEVELKTSDSGPSVFDAVKTLGLRLDRRKLLLDVLVVDSVSPVPSDN